MRLGDLDQLMDQVVRKKADWNNRKYMEGFNDCILRVRSMIHSAKTIDPESLPIVQELRAELKRAAVEPLSHFDRSKWKPCSKCKSCASCKDSASSVREMPCLGCEGYCYYSPRNFCPECGSPLTNAAWEMLEKRLEENMDDQP